MVTVTGAVHDDAPASGPPGTSDEADAEAPKSEPEAEGTAPPDPLAPPAEVGDSPPSGAVT